MTIRLRPNILYDINTGETLRPLDYTGIYSALTTGGYGAPNISASSVTATRLIWSSYLQEQAAAVVTDIESGREFTVTGASLTFGTKTLTAGSTYILFSGGTPTGSGEMTTTGRYCSVTDFLPTDVAGDEITPSLAGIDSTIFPDSVYSLQYEIYTTEYSAGAVTVSGSTKFIVRGDPGDTATVSGVVYAVGEIITSAVNFSFTGDATICKFYAETVDDDGNATPFYFCLAYYAYQAIKGLEIEVAQATCGCLEKKLEAIRLCWNKYNAVLYNFDDNLGLSISGCQNMLEQIIELVETAENC